jgi:hypothetical protein
MLLQNRHLKLKSDFKNNRKWKLQTKIYDFAFTNLLKKAADMESSIYDVTGGDVKDFLFIQY